MTAGSDGEVVAPVLAVDGLTVRFGGVLALDGVGFEVSEREICGLIGPNGAGKTTVFNCISRACEPEAGTIRFAGRDITHRPVHEIIGLGIARTFQNLGLLPGLTVLDNVLLGAHHRARPGFASAVCRPLASARRDRALVDDAMQALAWLDLAEVEDESVLALPLGTLKRVELARALVARPRLLLLDEPASGLTHAEVDALSAVVLEIRRRSGVAILLVEHHMRMVMQISDHVVVLDFGRTIADGTPVEVRADPRVITAYLGETRWASSPSRG